MKETTEYLDQQLKKQMIKLMNITSGILALAMFHYLGYIIYGLYKLVF